MMPARKIHMLDWTEGKDRTRKREDDRKKERKKERRSESKNTISNDKEFSPLI